MGLPIVDKDRILFGAPASVTVDGVHLGATKDAPVFSWQIERSSFAHQGAGGNVKGLMAIAGAVGRIVMRVSEFTSQRLTWVWPNAATSSSASIGQLLAGLATTLAADPALGDVIVKVTSVTTVTVGQFVLIGPASAQTELNTEVLEVLTVGTAGAGGTGLGVRNDTGGGLRIDHSNGENINTITGTKLAAPAAAGATTINPASVSALIVGDLVRIGALGRYETRQLTAVGTAGVGGTGITFAVPLSMAHSLDEWVIEVTGTGTTRVQPQLGVIPDASYHTLVLTGKDVAGRSLVVTLNNALSVENGDLGFNRTDWAGTAITMESNYDRTNPDVVPFTVDIAA